MKAKVESFVIDESSRNMRLENKLKVVDTFT